MVAGILVVIFVFFPLWKALSKLRKASQSRSWPTVEGKVIRSEIVERQTREGKIYGIGFEYTYQVSGQDFTSEGRFLDEEYGRSWVGDLKDFVDSHPVGKSVDVYYQPDAPATSAIINGVQTRYYIIVLLCLVFVGVGAALMALGLSLR